jgi:hypothetical protein
MVRISLSSPPLSPTALRNAVVAWSLRARVLAVRVKDQEGSGGADIVCAFVDQLAVCFAGGKAPEVFKQPSHDLPNFLDRQRVETLPTALPDEQKLALRTAGRMRAQKYLIANQSKVITLAERLVECGCVEEAEFLRLMQDAD